eukprot:g4830.t1
MSLFVHFCIVLLSITLCLRSAKSESLHTEIQDDGIEVTRGSRHLSQFFFRSGQCGSSRTVVLFNGRRPDLKQLSNFSPPMTKVDASDVEYIPLSRAECLRDASGLPGNLIIFDNGRLSDLSVLSGIYQIGGDFILFGTRDNEGSLKSLKGLENLSVVGGSLNIVQIDGIQDLSDLKSLRQVSGELLIWNNAKLRSLDGLQKLQRIGKALIIDNNRSMKTLKGLENLSEIGFDLFLKGNGQLSDLSHLQGVRKVWGNVAIEGMNALKTTKDLKNIQTIGIGIDIYNNPRLEDLSGFESLTEINGDLSICRNKNLKTTRGFEGVKRIHLNLVVSQNEAIQDLTGFKAITEIGGLVSIQDNQALERLQGLGKIDDIAEDLVINRNPELKSLEDLAVSMIGTNIGGNVLIEDNKSLISFGVFPEKLKKINGGVRIEGNNQLNQKDIDAIYTKSAEN